MCFVTAFAQRRGAYLTGGEMSQERHEYEVERQLEEQEHMRNCYKLMIQDEDYDKWLNEIQKANIEHIQKMELAND